VKSHDLGAVAYRALIDYSQAGVAECRCGELVTAVSGSLLGVRRIIERKHKAHVKRERAKASA
jgi:hypothetical protein